MELRLHHSARATKDIDLSLPEKRPREQRPHSIREQLQELTSQDLGDWFEFLIGAPILELDAAPYGGARFPVEVRLAGRKFATFHLDVGVGDAIMSQPEWIDTEDVLAFAEIPPARVAILPKEQHFAEKVHAYTLPRADLPNSRVKDLVDMVLLLELGLPGREEVRKAVRATFQRRRTHEIPALFPAPPELWSGIYDALAAECGVKAKSLAEAHEVVEGYWANLSLGASQAP
jgi:hypothetical protein